jgi:hypothetical protein
MEGRKAPVLLSSLLREQKSLGLTSSLVSSKHSLPFVLLRGKPGEKGLTSIPLALVSQSRIKLPARQASGHSGLYHSPQPNFLMVPCIVGHRTDKTSSPLCTHSYSQNTKEQIGVTVRYQTLPSTFNHYSDDC